MFPHFYWHGKDSRDMGLWISKLPPITKPKERTTDMNVPGRAGSLTMTEGKDVYDSYVRQCVITAPFYADFEALTDWLRGEGKVVFSNELNRAYTARIAGEVAFEPISNSLRQATIPFYVHPYKEQFPTEAAITITGTSGTLQNPGTVASRPIVTITYTGDLEVTICGVTMSFTWLSSSSPITVDCGAEIITQGDSIWEGTFGGDFWSIPVGSSSVAANHSCTLAITPCWRWV